MMVIAPLHTRRGKDALARALARARRAGHPTVRCAADLAALLAAQRDGALQRLLEAEDDAPADEIDIDEPAGRFAPGVGARVGTGAGAAGGVPSVGSPAAVLPQSVRDKIIMRLWWQHCDPAGTSSAAASLDNSASSNSTFATNGSGAEDGQFWDFPLHPSVVSVVQTAAQLRAIRQSIEQLAPEAQRSASGPSLPPACGLDCEWDVYERGSARTPVAIAQLAFRDAVYIIDLLAICGVGPAAEVAGTSGQGASGDASGGAPAASVDFTAASVNRSSGQAAPFGAQHPLLSGAAAAAMGGSGSQALPSSALSEAQAELSLLLEALMGSAALLKVGFHMRNDLERLRVRLCCGIFAVESLLISFQLGLLAIDWLVGTSGALAARLRQRWHIRRAYYRARHLCYCHGDWRFTLCLSTCAARTVAQKLLPIPLPGRNRTPGCLALPPACPLPATSSFPTL